MKLDILVLAAHPDDAELGCGATIAKHVSLGYKVGVVDFTRGELGTRGTPEIREKEATASASILGLTVRENLGLKDGFFQNTQDDQLPVVRAVRKYQPEIVIANAMGDRHPDHGKGASLSYDSCFLAGLAKVETIDNNGIAQKPWRPRVVYHYIQSEYLLPDVVVDVSEHWEIKMRAIRAFKSQFYDPSNTEPATYISDPAFLKILEARAIDLGYQIGAKYGEGFQVRRAPGINSLFDLR